MTNESTVTRRREGGGAASQTEAHSKTGDVTFRPPLDLYDFDDRYEALFDIPGTTTENIDVTVHDGVLTVEACVEPRYPGHITPMLGEFGVGDFRRQVRLGEDIDTDSITAEYRDGVLMLTLPKRAERRPRKVEVRGG